MTKEEQDRVAALEQENRDLKRTLAGAPPMRQPGQDATLKDCHKRGVLELGALQTREVKLTPQAAATIVAAAEKKTK